MNKELETIAKEHLGVETLEVRGLDRLDFHDVGVVGIRKALEAAFELGKKKAYTKDDLGWLINGIEVEMEAIKDTLKDWPVDKQDEKELKANYAEQEVLLKKLQESLKEVE